MIVIDYKAPFFLLSFNLNAKDLSLVKNLPVRKWDKFSKLWKVPRLAVKSLVFEDSYWTEQATEAKTKIELALTELVEMKFAEGTKRGILRPYQDIGSKFLVQAKKALLADDMGLGKTVQAIQALIDSNSKQCLIICPASLKFKWADEFQKHFGIVPTIIGGSKEERRLLWQSTDKFLIANYELLQGRLDWPIMPHKFDAVVCDEAIYLKNHKAERTKRVKQLESDYKFALSGIYIENSLLEFQSIMEWIRPEVVPSAYKFKYRYCDIDPFTGEVVGANIANLPELHALTSPFVLRREKKAVLKDLPDKIYVDVPLEMSKEEKAGYMILSNAYRNWIKSRAHSDSSDISLWDGTMDCRMFVEYPNHVNHDWTYESTKLTWLKELYKEIDKLVVFSFFKRSIDSLQAQFGTRFIISGGVDASERFPTVNEFNVAKKGILVSTDAGRFGLDMIGASNLVHYGYVHNPGTMIQREDRLWRDGQKNVVTIFRPYLKNTIDEGILKIYQSRLVNSKEFMSGSEQMSKVKLSIKDYLSLIEGVYHG